MPDRRFLTDRFLRSLPPAKRPPKEVARRALPGIVCGDCLSGLFGSHRRTVSRHTHRGAVIASRRFHSVINHRHALATRRSVRRDGRAGITARTAAVSGGELPVSLAAALPGLTVDRGTPLRSISRQTA